MLKYSTISAEQRHTVTRRAAMRGRDQDIPMRSTNVQTQSPLLSIEIKLLEKIQQIAMQPGTETEIKDRTLYAYCESASCLG